MSNYLCNLVLPGAAKSGTSTLHEMLGRHPDIVMSQPKEPQFFSFDELYDRGSDFHNSLFDERPGVRWYGESSQSYMVHEQALERVAQALEGPKAIFLLRHPIERAFSHYCWNYKLGVESESLLSAVAERGEDTGYEWDERVCMYRERGGYLAFSRYSRWVPVWQRKLGRENVLLVRTADLRHDYSAVASRCFAFLGLPDSDIGASVERNTTRKTRRLVAPLWARAAARITPKWIKETDWYEAVSAFIGQAYTVIPPQQLTAEEKHVLEAELQDELEFYSNMKLD